jgi:hypothetical protein
MICLTGADNLRYNLKVFSYFVMFSYFKYLGYHIKSRILSSKNSHPAHTLSPHIQQ